MDISTFKKNLLSELYGSLSHLTTCPLKTYGCSKLVFGEGNSNAKLVLIGEAPGRDEDDQGRPFVGRSGRLLTRTLVSLGVKREDVYITNIVKCRPPDNRKPLPSEVLFFKPLLLQELKIIRPKIICTLGSSALEGLIPGTYSITRIRGEMLDYDGIPLIPTFHPAYVLRNNTAEKEFKHDLAECIKIAQEPSSGQRS